MTKIVITFLFYIRIMKRRKLHELRTANFLWSDRDIIWVKKTTTPGRQSVSWTISIRLFTPFIPSDYLLLTNHPLSEMKEYSGIKPMPWHVLWKHLAGNECLTIQLKRSLSKHKFIYNNIYIWDEQHRVDSIACTAALINVWFLHKCKKPLLLAEPPIGRRLSARTIVWMFPLQWQ